MTDRSNAIPRIPGWLALLALAALLFIALGLPLLLPAQTPAPAAAPAAPDESKLYVWAAPEKGYQSLLILEILSDGQTCEAAYLVPCRFKLPAKFKKEDLDKVLPGRLHAVSLLGRDAQGTLQGNIWMGKDQGWLVKPK